MSDWKQELLVALRPDAPFARVWHKLKELKERGVDRLEIQKVIEEMRTETVDEATDDRLCDALDLATGFCAPHAWIWDFNQGK